MTNYRRKCLDDRINCCWACGDTDNLEVHHVDGDRDNNDFDNLLPLCYDCHQRVHNEKVGKSPKRIEALKDQLPESKLCTVGGPRKSVSLRDDQWLYLYETQQADQTFPERFRALLGKGIEAEKRE